MNRRSGILASIVLLTGLLFPVAVSPTVACAASDDSAALVVDTGGSSKAYCVELPSGSVDGIGLIKLASDQYGLSYSLGFGGKAVCALNGVGVTSSNDCFADMPNYWGYWVGNGSGGWNWASVGAASVSVDPGDIQGWAWGSGKDGSSHPAPPSTEYEDVCKADSGGGGGNGGGGNGGGGNGGGGGDSDDDGNGGGSGGGGDQDKDDDATGGDKDDKDADDDKDGSGSSKPEHRDGNGGDSDGAGEADAQTDEDGTGTVEPRSDEGTAALATNPSPAEEQVILAEPLSASADRPRSVLPLGGLAAIVAILALGFVGYYRSRGREARHRAGRTKA